MLVSTVDAAAAVIVVVAMAVSQRCNWSEVIFMLIVRSLSSG